MGGVCTRGKEVHPEEQDQNNLGSNTGPQQSGDKQTGGKGASRQNSARTRESFDGESMESARMATHRSGAPLNSSRSNRGQLNSHRSDGGGGRQNSFRSGAEAQRRTPRNREGDEQGQRGRRDSEESMTDAERQLVNADLKDKLEYFANPHAGRAGSSKFTVVTRAKSEKKIEGVGWYPTEDIEKFKLKRARSRKKEVKKWAESFKSKGGARGDASDDEDAAGLRWLARSETEPDIREVVRTASMRERTMRASPNAWSGFESSKYDAGPAEKALRRSRTQGR